MNKEQLTEKLNLKHRDPNNGFDRLHVKTELHRLSSDVDTVILQAIWNEWFKPKTTSN